MFLPQAWDTGTPTSCVTALAWFDGAVAALWCCIKRA